MCVCCRRTKVRRARPSAASQPHDNLPGLAEEFLDKTIITAAQRPHTENNPPGGNARSVVREMTPKASRELIHNVHFMYVTTHHQPPSRRSDVAGRADNPIVKCPTDGVRRR